jgi:choline-sulfatase
LENLPPVLKNYSQKAHGFDPNSLTKQEILRVRTAYYAMVTHMDRLCGNIFKALKRSGRDKDTIVIYLSDHGEMLGERELWWKWSFFEGSVRVPMIISWPERLPRNVRIPEVISLLDIGPTFIDIAGGQQLQDILGKSITSILYDRDDRCKWSNKAMSEINTKSEMPPGKMIRKDRWKLIKYHGHEPILYDLQQDPQEIVNKAADNRSVVDELLVKLEENWNPELLAETCNRNRKALNVFRQYYETVHPAEPERWPGFQFNCN